MRAIYFYILCKFVYNNNHVGDDIGVCALSNLSAKVSGHDVRRPSIAKV